MDVSDDAGVEELIHRGVHEVTQYFVHETMGGPTRKAVKYEKKALKAQLMQLRNMCADWSKDPALLLDEKTIVSKEFKFEQVEGWKAGEEETVDGESYQTGLAAYKAQTIFGEKTVQAKALIKGGKVVKWIYAKTGMEIR